MENFWLMKEYFAIYLREIRHVSEKSIANYFDALKWISQFLCNKQLIQSSIYEVTDFVQLQSIRSILFDDEEFKNLNTRGRQMYSSGMNNYLRFAEARNFSGLSQKLPV